VHGYNNSLPFILAWMFPLGIRYHVKIALVRVQDGKSSMQHQVSPPSHLEDALGIATTAVGRTSYLVGLSLSTP